MRNKKIAIVGCVGVPAAYGGFETLAENLALYQERCRLAVDLTIFCSKRWFSVGGPEKFHGATLRYLALPANGVYSIVYDVYSLLLAIRARADAVLVLGVSGAIALPLVRVFSDARVVTNIDGIEWRRMKWGKIARYYLRISEWLAIRCSHVVVADNQGVAEHVERSYGVSPAVIAYGGDHAVDVAGRSYPTLLPPRYALALCRIEPENNVEMILEAFSHSLELPLVFVGNWSASVFGRDIRARYRGHDHLVLLDPEYDLGALKTLRAGASLYVHGHSAGGTNPSLVEMMHFGIPVIAFDCAFNRYTTHDRALYFFDAESLASAVAGLSPVSAVLIGKQMLEIARRCYIWHQIGAQYFSHLQAVPEDDGAMR